MITTFAALAAFSAILLGRDTVSSLIEQLLASFLVFGGTLGLLLVGYLAVNRMPADADKASRAIAAEFQQFEKNVKQDIFRELSTQVSDEIVPLDFVTRQIQDRLDEGLVKAIDDALRKRLAEGARWVDIIGYIDDVQARIWLQLDGPGGRAEKLSQALLYGAIGVGALGLGIAIFRVFTLGDLSSSLVALSNSLGGKSAWPFVAALATPWISLIALVEFSALMLLKVSNQFAAEQRRYTEILIGVTERLLALKIIVRAGTGEEICKAASHLLREVKAVEVKDATMEESISAITKITESLVNVIKQLASKETKPLE